MACGTHRPAFNSYEQSRIRKLLYLISFSYIQTFLSLHNRQVCSCLVLCDNRFAAVPTAAHICRPSEWAPKLVPGRWARGRFPIILRCSMFNTHISQGALILASLLSEGHLSFLVPTAMSPHASAIAPSRQNVSADVASCHTHPAVIPRGVHNGTGGIGSRSPVLRFSSFVFTPPYL